MSQLALALAEPRRIDETLRRLDALVEEMPPERQSALAEQPWWGLIVIVSRLRSMEMAEQAVLGRAIEVMADAYDRLVQPGENAVEALLRTFRAVYGVEHNAMPEVTRG